MSPPLAVAALAVALALHAELLARLRTAEPAKPWWFGYARDGANLSASLMLWGGYLLLGYRAPAALLIALVTALVTYLLDWTIARGLGLARARLVLAAPIAVWLAIIAFAAGPIGSTIEWLIAANQPL